VIPSIEGSGMAPAESKFMDFEKEEDHVSIAEAMAPQPRRRRGRP
jgi:hypothetical protein